MPLLTVHLTPEQIPAQEDSQVCVMVDIFRASSTIITALFYGAKGVIPFNNLDVWRQSAGLPNYLLAGERGGQQLPEAVFDNSPISFLSPTVQGKTIALTTTNGTQALSAMQNCGYIVVGGFHNLTVLAEYLKKRNDNVQIVCAGWNGAISLEDTYFAGALVNQLLPTFQQSDDGALIAQATYHAYRGDPLNFLRNGQHFQRLLSLDKESDVSFCLQQDIHPIIPILDGYQIRLLPESAQ